MHRTVRSLVVLQVALLAAAFLLPAAAAASAPTGATLTILNAGCSAAPGTVTVGDTICARAVVTVTGTGAGEYRTHWYGPGAFSPTFQDVHALSGAGTFTFQDSHPLTTAGVWTVRACKTSGCATGASILATRAFSVAGAPTVTPTTLTVGAATGTYAGNATLTATLQTTSGASPVAGATVTFTLPGGAAGSATTDATGVATLADMSLGTTGAGEYPTGVGASFAGTSTTGASSGTGPLTIARAGSTTVVTCADGTFTGSALEPCSASVTGVGGLDESLLVSYADNTNAGTGQASASFAGDANHEPSSDEATFEIGRASSATDVSCPSTMLYTGSPQTPCTASVSGAGGLDASVDVSYAGNLIGTATATATFDGDANHDGSSASATFVIEFGWTGFDEPIGTAGHGAAGKGFKAGQTIPVKFALWDAAGDPVLMYGTPTFSRTDNLGSCSSTPSVGTAPAATPDAGSPFTWTGAQYLHDWSTRGLTAGLYRIFAQLADGTARYQDVCLTR